MTRRVRRRRCALRPAPSPRPVALELDLDVFDGPFDLLVTLILRDEVDLWEVRVSRIIAEYVLRLADSGEFDLEATSQFIVLVAALLEMKSRLLLEEEVDEELEELDPTRPREELLERLVRYSQFATPPSALQARWDEHARGSTARRRVPARFCAGAAPDGALPARALWPPPWRRCCASRRRPTRATSPTSPSPWWPSCAGCGTCSPTRASSPSPPWRRATGSRRR